MHYSLMIVHRDGESIEKLMEPFQYDKWDWYQDAGKRNWPKLKTKDGQEVYSCKFSEIEIEAMKDFTTYSVLFNRKWYSRLLSDDERRRIPVEDWVKDAVYWDNQVKETIVPSIKPEDIITILDYHN